MASPRPGRILILNTWIMVLPIRWWTSVGITFGSWLHVAPALSPWRIFGGCNLLASAILISPRWLEPGIVLTLVIVCLWRRLRAIIVRAARRPIGPKVERELCQRGRGVGSCRYRAKLSRLNWRCVGLIILFLVRGLFGWLIFDPEIVLELLVHPVWDGIEIRHVRTVVRRGLAESDASVRTGIDILVISRSAICGFTRLTLFQSRLWLRIWVLKRLPSVVIIWLLLWWRLWWWGWLTLLIIIRIRPAVRTWFRPVWSWVRHRARLRSMSSRARRQARNLWRLLRRKVLSVRHWRNSRWIHFWLWSLRRIPRIWAISV